jgi:hypothetical protein
MKLWRAAVVENFHGVAVEPCSQLALERLILGLSVLDIPFSEVTPSCRQNWL